MFIQYHTVHTHFDIVYTHLGTVHTLFSSYDTDHKHFDIIWHSSHIVRKL